MMIFKRNKILSFNFISIPPDCLDIFSEFSKRVIHLLPQVADMHRYGIIALAEILITPVSWNNSSALTTFPFFLHRICRIENSVGVRERGFSSSVHSCVLIFSTRPECSEYICIRFITGVVPLIPAGLGLHCHRSRGRNGFVI